MVCMNFQILGESAVSGGPLDTTFSGSHGFSMGPCDTSAAMTGRAAPMLKMTKLHSFDICFHPNV